MATGCIRTKDIDALGQVNINCWKNSWKKHICLRMSVVWCFLVFFLLRPEPDGYKSLLLVRLMPISFTWELICYIILVAGQICNPMCLQYFLQLKTYTMVKTRTCCDAGDSSKNDLSSSHPCLQRGGKSGPCYLPVSNYKWTTGEAWSMSGCSAPALSRWSQQLLSPDDHRKGAATNSFAVLPGCNSGMLTKF